MNLKLIMAWEKDWVRKKIHGLKIRSHLLSFAKVLYVMRNH